MWIRYEQGASCADIGKEFGMSRQLVRWRFTSAGKPVKKAIRDTDLTGRVSGRLTALHKAPDDPRSKKNGAAYWTCRCECGKVLNVLGQKIRTKHTQSCGCIRRTGKRHWIGHGEISGTYWSVVVRGAEDRGLPMEVTIEHAWDLFLKQKRLCAFTGIELGFSRTRVKSSEQTASFDRIDSSKGYVVGNVQWVHKHVNVMKQATGDDEFIGWCMTIAHHSETARYKDLIKSLATPFRITDGVETNLTLLPVLATAS
jgi:hypothetical protein